MMGNSYCGEYVYGRIKMTLVNLRGNLGLSPDTAVA